MINECGFSLHGMCCSDDMECYGNVCEYKDVSGCPVHISPDEINEHGELHLYKGKLNFYKHEVTKLRSVCATQEQTIQRLTKCICECDPWLCEQIKEGLKV
jgi:hypothetical protein